MNYRQIPQNVGSILPKHFQEWRQSAVDPDIIQANVTSLDGDAAIERLIYALPDSERRNDGRIRDKWLRKYRHDY